MKQQSKRSLIWKPIPCYQSKTIRGTKYVSYDAQLCPLIDKGQRAPNAQVTCQIVNRHSEELKSSSPDSQTHKNPDALIDTIILPGGTVGYPAPPRLIRESVRLSVSPVCLYSMPAD